MIYELKKFQTKDGRNVVFRNAEEKDAENLLDYLRRTSQETPYLMREPEEVTLTIEQEKIFIKNRMDAERELLLIAETEGEFVGNCSLSACMDYQRYRHRCSVAIALYQKYCGLGIGKQMLLEVLKEAKQCGYEQAELEVVATNTAAVALYKKLGFEVYGTQVHSMKYKDGTYADEYLMWKML